MKHSIILVSGGMDSITLLYDKQEEIKMALFFDYGANHNKQELRWAEYHCEKLGIPLVKISLDFMTKYFAGNILHDQSGAKNESDFDCKKNSVVPFRNGIMLSIACGIAESNEMDCVLIANHMAAETLPDCSQKFVDCMNDAMVSGTYCGVRICAPYTGWKKSDIIKRGNTIGVDYTHTYSCYKGGDIHCGVCPACIERKEAVELSGVIDNTEYEQ